MSFFPTNFAFHFKIKFRNFTKFRNMSSWVASIACLCNRTVFLKMICKTYMTLHFSSLSTAFFEMSGLRTSSTKNCWIFFVITVFISIFLFNRRVKLLFFVSITLSILLELSIFKIYFFGFNICWESQYIKVLFFWWWFNFWSLSRIYYFFFLIIILIFIESLKFFSYFINKVWVNFVNIFSKFFLNAKFGFFKIIGIIFTLFLVHIILFIHLLLHYIWWVIFLIIIFF